MTGVEINLIPCFVTIWLVMAGDFNIDGFGYNCVQLTYEIAYVVALLFSTLTCCVMHTLYWHARNGVKCTGGDDPQTTAPWKSRGVQSSANYARPGTFIQARKGPAMKQTEAQRLREMDMAIYGCHVQYKDTGERVDPSTLRVNPHTGGLELFEEKQAEKKSKKRLDSDR